jgi:hypothetical protein
VLPLVGNSMPSDAAEPMHGGTAQPSPGAQFGAPTHALVVRGTNPDV